MAETPVRSDAGTISEHMMNGSGLAEAAPRPFLWTVEEFQAAGEAGAFEGGGRRVQLVEGEIYEVVINSRHVTSVLLTAEALRRTFGLGFVVRTEAPLHLTFQSDPEPDVAVVPGEIRDWATEHPTTALLVIEVADTTLNHDTGRKASLYASAHISDYWVLNLNDETLHVFRNSGENSSAPFGWKYASEQVLQKGESVAPLAKADVLVAVSDLLP